MNTPRRIALFIVIIVIIIIIILEYKIKVRLKQARSTARRSRTPGGKKENRGSVITSYTKPRPTYVIFTSVLENKNHVTG